MSKNSEEVRRCQKRKKQNVVDLFGGKCSMCGYNKCIGALEFHHLEKDEKEEEPSYIIMRWSLARAKKELEKCILVCANCHREIHAEEFEKLNINLQNFVKPWLTLICNHCKREFETKEEYKYCTQNCSQYSQRKVLRPTKEELSALILTTNWTQLGKLFGVSDNGVRNWAKRYKLI